MVERCLGDVRGGHANDRGEAREAMRLPGGERLEAGRREGVFRAGAGAARVPEEQGGTAPRVAAKRVTASKRDARGKWRADAGEGTLVSRSRPSTVQLIAG